MLPLLDNSKNPGRYPDDRPFTRSVLGLGVCLSLTTRVHRVRFPAGAPDPRVGLPGWLGTIETAGRRVAWHQRLKPVNGGGPAFWVSSPPLDAIPVHPHVSA